MLFEWMVEIPERQLHDFHTLTWHKWNENMSQVWKKKENSEQDPDPAFSFPPVSWRVGDDWQESQLTPTDMVIIFKLLRFEIMTSFVTNNHSLSMLFTHWICVCVGAPHVAVLASHSHCRNQQEKMPLMILRVNRAQPCSCPQATPSFGISLPLCPGSCVNAGLFGLCLHRWCQKHSNLF